jgi:hypothetical protein
MPITLLVLSAAVSIFASIQAALADVNGAVTGGNAAVGGLDGAAIGNSVANHSQYYHHGYPY